MTFQKGNRSRLGEKLPEEHRRAISNGLKGRKFSDEHKKKLSEALKKRKIKDSTRAKLSEKLKGNTRTLGYKHSEEAKRKISEAMKGEKHPLWRGGISYEPYCPAFAEKLKEAVRETFGRKCFVCGVPENGRKHDIHHVDYNKGQGCGQKWNLIPLCTSCHPKTNYHRYYWFNLLSNYWAMNDEFSMIGGFQW